MALVLAAAALAWLAYRALGAWPRRRAALSALRVMTLMLLVVVLMRPVTQSTAADTRDVVVPVLIDSSRSMAIDDADGERRIDAARALVEQRLLPALGAFTVEVLSFGERVAPVESGSVEASARRSDLAAALGELRERYRGRPVAGALVISDGGDTGWRVGADEFDPLVPPVYPMGLGSPRAPGDREVLSVTAAEAVLDGSLVDLAVSAVAHDSAGESVELRLLENGRLRDVRHVRPAAVGGPIREIFQVAPPAGVATVYTVEIPAKPAKTSRTRSKTYSGR
jgi:hypothetical protein